jgi:hypothetical protein
MKKERLGCESFVFDTVQFGSICEIDVIYSPIAIVRALNSLI